jgi:hypothetical protein
MASCIADSSCYSPHAEYSEALSPWRQLLIAPAFLRTQLLRISDLLNKMSAAQKRLALYIVVSIILLGSMYMNASLMLTSGKDQTNLAETVVRKDDQRNRFKVLDSKY